MFLDVLSCFLFDGLAYFCVHYSLFIVAVPRRFSNRARVGDDSLDLCGLLIALPTIDAHCWLMLTMVSLMVSMSSSFCNVSNLFLNSILSSIFFDPIRVTSVLGSLLVINMCSFPTLLPV